MRISLNSVLAMNLLGAFNLLPQVTDRVFTVCELLANPAEFQGQRLRVLGIEDGGLEGTWLQGKSCPTTVSVEGLTLAKAIWLTYQSEYDIKVQRNGVHIKEVSRQLRKRSKKSLHNFALIYEGVFETRDKWLIFHDSSGQARVWGLGHLNGFPAQLVLIDVELPSSKPKIPKKDKE